MAATSLGANDRKLDNKVHRQLHLHPHEPFPAHNCYTLKNLLLGVTGTEILRQLHTTTLSRHHRPFFPSCDTDLEVLSRSRSILAIFTILHFDIHRPQHLLPTIWPVAGFIDITGAISTWQHNNPTASSLPFIWSTPSLSTGNNTQS